MSQPIQGIVVALAAWTVVLSDGARADETSSPPTNFVVILADDLGWSDVGCYGADLHETPSLDALASNGVRFTDAYAASICSPTRASLLTGRHHARLNITIWREGSLRQVADRKLIPPRSEPNLPHAELTLAEVFQAAGYLTALIGKWHLGDAPFYPETQGFDINIGGTLWGAPNTYFFPYRGSRRLGGEFRYVPYLEMGVEGEYLTDRLTDEAIRVIDRAGSKPFFLYLAHHAPHTPIEAKEDLVRRYREKQKPGQRHANPVYAAMVHSLDESVGRIVDHLNQRGLADRTVVVFVSDNGGQIGKFDDVQVTNNQPLRSGKGSLYEGGVRVPLLVRWPENQQAGATCTEPVWVGDLFPTLLELAGLADRLPKDLILDGRSLVPLLRDPNGRLDREALFFHYPHYYSTTAPASAVRERDWKLIEYFEDARTELYHLSEDLGEQTDVAARHPDRVSAMHAKLTQWRKEVRAQVPKANPQAGAGATQPR